MKIINPRVTVTVKRPLAPLMPHQERAVSYLRDRQLRGLGGALFMEMRLGKTSSVIRFIRRYLPEAINLVIAPKSVMHAWANELKNNNNIFDYTMLLGDKEDRIELIGTDCRWFILNYEMAEKLDILSYHFDTCIFDESIRISNPQAKVTKYLLKFIDRIKLRYILCGNPAPETPLQYVSQFLVMHGQYMGKYTYWAVRASYYENRGYEWYPMHGVNNKIYEYVHANAFILTRKQAGIGSSKTYMTRHIEMNAEQKRAYNKMLTEFEFDGVETAYHMSQSVYLAKIAGGVDISSPENDLQWFSEAKIDEIAYLLKTELRDQQVLVWTRFKHEAYKITDVLAKLSIAVDVVTGDVSADHRELIRQEFMKGRIRVVVCTIKANKIGNNWSAASAAIYYSNEMTVANPKIVL